MVPIIINGRAGSGKSTMVKKLSAALNLPTVDTGQMWRKMAADHRMSMVEFAQYCNTHPEVDRQLDAQVTEKIEAGNKITQSRTLAPLFKREKKPFFGVFLEASEATQAKRLANREKIDFATALADNRRRDAADQARYRKIYGIDINDLSVYHLVVITDDKNPDQIRDIILSHLPDDQTNNHRAAAVPVK